MRIYTMKTTLTKEQAISILLQDKWVGWTYDEAEALFNWYEMYEEDTGEEIEFDAVAIRCEWASESKEEICENYGIDPLYLISQLNMNTSYIELPSGKILYQPW